MATRCKQLQECTELVLQFLSHSMCQAQWVDEQHGWMAESSACRHIPAGRWVQINICTHTQTHTLANRASSRCIKLSVLLQLVTYQVLKSKKTDTYCLGSMDVKLIWGKDRFKGVEGWWGAIHWRIAHHRAAYCTWYVGWQNLLKEKWRWQASMAREE